LSQGLLEAFETFVEGGTVNHQRGTETQKNAESCGLSSGKSLSRMEVATADGLLSFV
jgi:hypothetical protein